MCMRVFWSIGNRLKIFRSTRSAVANPWNTADSLQRKVPICWIIIYKGTFTGKGWGWKTRKERQRTAAIIEVDSMVAVTAAEVQGRPCSWPRTTTTGSTSQRPDFLTVLSEGVPSTYTYTQYNNNNAYNRVYTKGEGGSNPFQNKQVWDIKILVLEPI